MTYTDKKRGDKFMYEIFQHFIETTAWRRNTIYNKHDQGMNCQRFVFVCTVHLLVLRFVCQTNFEMFLICLLNFLLQDKMQYDKKEASFNDEITSGTHNTKDKTLPEYFRTATSLIAYKHFTVCYSQLWQLSVLNLNYEFAWFCIHLWHILTRILWLLLSSWQSTIK